MKVYTYSQARQQLSALLDEAARDGVAQIRRQDGRVFTVCPVRAGRSPLDVPGVASDVTTPELVAIIREGRERDYGAARRQTRTRRKAGGESAARKAPPTRRRKA